MDPSDLLGEAGVLAAVFATISAALAGIASYYARAPSAANAKRGRPPRVDRKTLLSLLENSARNAHTAQIEAYQSVVNADTQLGGGGFGGFLGGRMGGGGRRRPAPTPDQVSALFRSRFEELDAELLAANTPPGGSGLTGEDVQHALRYYGADKDVQAVERKVLATDPLAVALNPVELSQLLELGFDSDDEAPCSPEALLGMLQEITDAAPSHFQAAVEGLMQASQGQPGPQFLQQAVLASRGAAAREVLAPGSGSAWAGRQSSFEFAVDLVSRASPEFEAAYRALVTRNMRQLSGLMQGGGE